MICYICNPNTDAEIKLTKSNLRKIKQVPLCGYHKEKIDYYLANPGVLADECHRLLEKCRKFRGTE